MSSYSSFSLATNRPTKQSPTTMNSSQVPLNLLMDSVTTLVSKIEIIDKLSVENDRISQNSTRQFGDFMRKMSHYRQYWPFPYELFPLDSHSYKYNPTYLPTSGNVSFVTIDTMASCNKALKKNKINTWIMCPVCDPFKNATNPSCPDTRKKITINGKAECPSIKSPIHGFYSTLNSSYIHHMAECHGAYGQMLFKQPILGFMGPNMKFTAMCPYDNDETHMPCLATNDFSLKAGDGFKAYYRHVEHFHAKKGNHDSKLGKKTSYYNKSCVFVPLSLDAFESISKSRLEKRVRIISSIEAQTIIHSRLSYMKTTNSVTLDSIYPQSGTFQLIPQQPVDEVHYNYIPQEQEQHQYQARQFSDSNDPTDIGFETLNSPRSIEISKRSKLMVETEALAIRKQALDDLEVIIQDSFRVNQQYQAPQQNTPEEIETNMTSYNDMDMSALGGAPLCIDPRMFTLQPVSQQTIYVPEPAEYSNDVSFGIEAEGPSSYINQVVPEAFFHEQNSLPEPMVEDLSESEVEDNEELEYDKDLDWELFGDTFQEHEKPVTPKPVLYLPGQLMCSGADVEMPMDQCTEEFLATLFNY